MDKLRQSWSLCFHSYYCAQSCSQLCQTVLLLHLSYFSLDNGGEGGGEENFLKVFFSGVFFPSLKKVLLSPSWQTFELSLSFVPWQKHKLPPIIQEQRWFGVSSFQVFFPPVFISCVPLPQRIPRNTK